MRCRRIVKSPSGVKNIVWFGSSGIRYVPVDYGFTCGADKICGNPYKYKNINMDVITILNTETQYEKQAIFYNKDDKHDNYASEKEAVRDSLMQRLSVIKNELWYDFNYGVPLVDQVRDKSIIDAWIIREISRHPDVNMIIGFESEVVKHEYGCFFIVDTVYGIMKLGI